MCNGCTISCRSWIISHLLGFRGKGVWSLYCIVVVSVPGSVTHTIHPSIRCSGEDEGENMIRGQTPMGLYL